MHHLQHVRSLLYFSSHSIPSDCMRVVNYDEGDEYCNQPIDSIEYIYIYLSFSSDGRRDENVRITALNPMHLMRLGTIFFMI